MDELLAARYQMAFTLGFHIVLAVLGIGMPVLMLLAEREYLRTGDAGWKELARRWSKAFAVLFAVGAVSGTVLSFELGLLWPKFMGTFGSVIGLPFTLEGFAFFTEAIFVGIYLYGWDRLSPRAHWWAGVPIALSGAASAWFVVTVNAWMNSPQGFEMVDGRVVTVDPIRAMLNPATWAQTTHMIVAAYIVAGFLVASYYAFLRLRGDTSAYTRRAMLLGIILGGAFAPVQMVVGDWAAQMVARTQPVKLAAMEGQFRTESGAPLRIGGIPNEETRETPYAIEIPYGLSVLGYHDPSAVVQGLDSVPEELQPPVTLPHIAFQLMVGIGVLLLALSAWCAWSGWRHKRLPQSRFFLTSVLLSGPLAVIALQAGWIVTEVGRQPWIVNGYMKVSEAVTTAPGIGWILLITIGIYALLLVGLVTVLRMLAKAPLQEVSHGA